MAKKPGHKQHKQYCNKFNKDVKRKKKTEGSFVIFTSEKTKVQVDSAVIQGLERSPGNS